MNIDWKKTERFIGGTKFAVIILSVYTLLMIIGTFVESFYGTAFAGRVIYKSPFFIFLQGALLISVSMSLMNRLPFKKKMIGFYVIHIGLILVFVGGYITYFAGIDGQITLRPSSPNRVVLLDEDVLYLKYEDGKEASYELPTIGFSKNINGDLDGLKIEEYIPFSSSSLEWLPLPNNHKDRFETYEYSFISDNSFRNTIMTLYPEGAPNFVPSVAFGEARIKLFPKEIKGCILDNKMKYVVWDRWNNRCGTIEEFNGVVEKQAQMNRSLVRLSFNETNYKFIPDFSTFPLNERFETLFNSPLHLISREMLESGRLIVLFGDHGYIFKGGKFVEFSLENGAVYDFSEFGFKLLLSSSHKNRYPALGARYTIPVKGSDGKIITTKAVKVRAGNEVYWIKSGRPVNLWKGGVMATLFIGKKMYMLPYELTLGEFKMDMNPGTRMAASYESFVNVFDGKTNKVNHVYMNNPMKIGDLTFYQSSYFEIGGGVYGSVLSVNMDPGRAMKYFGSLLLVLGAIAHYIIRTKKKEKTA